MFDGSIDRSIEGRSWEINVGCIGNLRILFIISMIQLKENFWKTNFLSSSFEERGTSTLLITITAMFEKYAIPCE